MPQINLLPWRAEQRKERKLAFLVALGGGTLAALLATFVIYLMFNSLISGQQQRNDRLKAEIATLDKQIEEINNLEAQKQRFISRMEIIEKLQRSRPEIVHVFDELLLDKQIEEINNLESAKQKFIARMEIIEKLQRSRPEIVHLFDEIVRTVPEGVYLTGVKQTDKRLKFEGVAQSSTRVSAFMRNIDGSEWLKNPDLEVIETKTGQVGGMGFTMYADQVSNVSDEDAAGAARTRVASSGGAQ